MYVSMGQKDIFVFQKRGPKSSAKYLEWNVLECFYFLPPRLLEQNSCQCSKVGGVPGNLLYLISLSATSVVFFMGVSSSLQFEIRLQSTIHSSGLRSETRDAKSREFLIPLTKYLIGRRLLPSVMSCRVVSYLTLQPDVPENSYRVAHNSEKVITHAD